MVQGVSPSEVCGAGCGASQQNYLGKPPGEVGVGPHGGEVEFRGKKQGEKQKKERAEKQIVRAK